MSEDVLASNELFRASFALLRDRTDPDGIRQRRQLLNDWGWFWAKHRVTLADKQIVPDEVKK